MSECFWHAADVAYNNSILPALSAFRRLCGRHRLRNAKSAYLVYLFIGFLLARLSSHGPSSLSDMFRTLQKWSTSHGELGSVYCCSSMRYCISCYFSPLGSASWRYCALCASGCSSRHAGRVCGRPALSVALGSMARSGPSEVGGSCAHALRPLRNHVSWHISHVFVPFQQIPAASIVPSSR